MADQASDNLFGGNTPPANQGAQGTAPNANPDNDLATLLGNIKNERGEPKYKNVQEALKALSHAQQFIPELKSKEQELEQKLNDALGKLSKMEELERTVLELTQRKPQETTTPSGVTAEEVAELVNRTLTKTQQEAIQKQNLDTVTNTVKAKFGDKAAEVFYGKAREMGMSNEEMNRMAAQAPKAVLKLIGIEDGVAQQRPSVTFNTDGFQPGPNTMIGRNKNSALIGATSQEIKEESDNARKMAEELRSQGKSVHDLTDPKVYFQLFGKG